MTSPEPTRVGRAPAEPTLRLVVDLRLAPVLDCGSEGKHGDETPSRSSPSVRFSSTSAVHSPVSPRAAASIARASLSNCASGSSSHRCSPQTKSIARLPACEVTGSPSSRSLTAVLNVSKRYYRAVGKLGFLRVSQGHEVGASVTFARPEVPSRAQASAFASAALAPPRPTRRAPSMISPGRAARRWGR